MSESFNKVKAVNIFDGKLYVRSNIKVKILDYTLDGVNWINHGIYMGDRMHRAEEIKANFLSVGISTDAIGREDVLFGHPVVHPLDSKNYTAQELAKLAEG
jgi:hypothetical protein